MKKFTTPLLITFIFIFSGCAAISSLSNRDLSQEGYSYRNKTLHFSLVLPDEFIYYQTQMVDVRGFVDLEVFVPTADRKYQQSVPGYAKPLVIRVGKWNDWQDLPDESEDKKSFWPIKESGDRIYLFKYWQDIPSDWQGKWTKELEQKIETSFKVI